MRITNDNYIETPSQDHILLKALLDDVVEINEHSNKKIYLDWQDYHNEYSPERVDPCPDFYGYYSIRWDNNNDMVSHFMTLSELDLYLCFLYEYVVE